MHDAVLISALRTAVGKFQGALASLSAIALGARAAARGLLRCGNRVHNFAASRSTRRTHDAPAILSCDESIREAALDDPIAALRLICANPVALNPVALAIERRDTAPGSSPLASNQQQPSRRIL